MGERYSPLSDKIRIFRVAYLGSGIPRPTFLSRVSTVPLTGDFSGKNYEETFVDESLNRTTLRYPLSR